LNKNIKHFLIYGINFSPELTGIGRYSGEMVEWLVSKNVKCTVVTSFPYYPNWQIQKPYSGWFYKKEKLNNGLLTIYRCPMYVPKKVNGTKRIIHEASFFVSSLFVIIYLLFKPKIASIFCVAPPFHLGLAAIFYKFFKGGKVYYHIQDLQIEAAKNLNMVKQKYLLNLFELLEKFILKHVDEISSISFDMVNKIELKVKKNVVLFPNWVDCNFYYPIQNSSKNRYKWGFNENQKIILYSGSIGEKQGLEKMLLLANNFKLHKEILFVIAGNGPYLEKLKQEAKFKNVLNLKFLPLQPNNIFNEFLNMVDIHLIFQKKNTGQLVMPSKLTTILAVGGLTLINADKDSSLHKLITENEIGFSVNSENINDLIIKLEHIFTLNNSIVKANARKYAEKELDKEYLLSNFFINK
jgi:colanic acid biosynthesis glycosyl transferase WcaI